MTVNEYLAAHTAGDIACADDNILAVNTGAEGASVGGFAAFAAGTAEVESNIISDSVRKKNVIGGNAYVKRGAVRKFTVTADRVNGDAAQEKLLSGAVKFGVYEEGTVEYAYINAATRSGERGKAVVNVVCDGSGKAGDPAGICIELYGCGTPVQA